MPTNWDEIAEKAAQLTDKQLASEISSLTRLNDKEILDLIQRENISQVDLANILKVVHSTASNEKKAEAIKNIKGGVDILLLLTQKII